MTKRAGTSATSSPPPSEDFDSGLDVIAFHLPQFHPIPENDAWWGVGFSEWRNVSKAKPLFPGHNQPLIPGDLGFYDLRLLETHAAQIELAKEAGLTAFCYYHYWFGGEKLLEKPIELFRDNPQLDFQYCMCWANHSWTGHWAGRSDEVLMEQTYPGEADDVAHYAYLSTFFKDPRYLRRDGKPIFLVFRPEDIPDVDEMCDRLSRLAQADGEPGLFLVANTSDRRFLKLGFDALAPHSFNDALRSYLKTWRRYVEWVKSRLFHYPRWTMDYGCFTRHFRNREMDGLTEFPTAVPNWDNTPRVGRRGVVLRNSSPQKFHDHLVDSTEGMRASEESGQRLLFIKSWNEWAEGNHLEPDLIIGKGWIEATRQFVDRYGKADGTRREGT